MRQKLGGVGALWLVCNFTQPSGFLQFLLSLSPHKILKSKPLMKEAKNLSSQSQVSDLYVIPLNIEVFAGESNRKSSVWKLHVGVP